MRCSAHHCSSLRDRIVEVYRRFKPFVVNAAILSIQCKTHVLTSKDFLAGRRILESFVRWRYSIKGTLFRSGCEISKNIKKYQNISKHIKECEKI